MLGSWFWDEIDMFCLIMLLSFAFPRVDPLDTAEGIVLRDEQNHLKPLDKGLKINDKQPFPRTKYEHPQHTIFYLVVKNNKTTLFNLLVSDLWLLYLSKL